MDANNSQRVVINGKDYAQSGERQKCDDVDEPSASDLVASNSKVVETKKKRKIYRKIIK